MTNDDSFYVGPAATPNKYRLIDCLGAGGEGEVWTADLRLSPHGRRRVAVKILRDDLIGRDDLSWERHANVLLSVSHPGLVRVLETFTGVRKHRADESPAAQFRHVVMDLVDGETLSEWLSAHPDSSLKVRLQTLRNVAAALDELHSGRQTIVPIAHGDVKPGNIVMREDDSAVLVDLGLMRIADGTIVAGGTAPYAAPELFRGGAFTSPEADRFAFAASVAHLVLGTTPPRKAEGMGLDLNLTDHLLANSPLGAGQHALRRQIMAALRAEPARRPQNLSRWLSGLIEVLSDRVPPEPRLTTAKAGRLGTLAATAGTVGLLAIALTGSGINGLGRSDPPASSPDGLAACSTTPPSPASTGAAPPGEVLIFASQDKDALLAELAKDYGQRMASGRCMTIRVEPRNSGKITRQLTSGWTDADGPRPDLWSPASQTWVRLTQSVAAPSPRPQQKPAIPESLFTTPVVIGVPEPMAKAWRAHKPEIGWEDLAELARDPQGWGKYGHPEWGAFRFGKTNPNYSSSGFAATVGAYFAATGRTDELVEADIHDSKAQEFIRGIERSVVHYGDTTLTFLSNLRRADDRDAVTSYISAVTVEESSLVAYNLGYPCGARSKEKGCAKKDPPKTKLVAIYPKEGTLYTEHPLVKLPGLDAAKTAIADDFLAYVHSEHARKKIGELGFRTYDTKATALLVPANGAVADIPGFRLNRPEAPVIRSILKVWPRLRKPARVLVVIDISGSMSQTIYPGGPTKVELVQRAKGALVDTDPVLGTDGFADSDQVGLWWFSDSLGGEDVDHKEKVAIAPMNARQRALLSQSIDSLAVQGGTGLYNTVAAAVAELRRAWDPEAINAVVVLSDGKNESDHGITKVEDLLPHIAPGRQPVRVFTIAYGRQSEVDENAGASPNQDPDDPKGDLERISSQTEARRYTAYEATAIKDVLIDVISNF